MRPREGGNEGEAIDTYDQWLAWEHGLKLRRTKAANARATVAPADLDWGEQMLIDASVQVVAPAASELVVYFYERLFAENPRLRALFPRDMTEQRERLLTALLTIVQDAGDPDELVVRLQQLGRDHRKFGAREAHYAAVGKALIGSLAAFAGAAWTPAIERAWLARYTVAADAMIAAADEDTQPPFWYATVVGHQRCAADLAILHVRPREPYRYTPGQYATIVSRRRPRVWRPYTMATAAPIDGVLEFHVRAVGHGGLSEVLVGDTAIGDVVRVGAPQGTTALRRPHDHVQVFVESGTGWAPTKAFLDQITRNGYVGAPAPHLIHVGSGGPPYDPAWTQLRDRWPGLSTVVAESPDEVGGCLPARVEPNQLEVYVSGPPGLTGSVSAQLAARGVGPRNMLLTSWPGA